MTHEPKLFEIQFKFDKAGQVSTTNYGNDKFKMTIVDFSVWKSAENGLPLRVEDFGDGKSGSVDMAVPI